MPIASPETTDLERRVLAHERILQALIAYMASTEPRFLDHLTTRFVEPMSMARHEHDHRETDDYAEEFVRAVVLLGEARVAKARDSEGTREQPTQPKDQGRLGPFQERSGQPGRIRVRERNGIWEVKVDGKFLADYFQKEQAVAAAALLKLSLR